MRKLEDGSQLHIAHDPQTKWSVVLYVSKDQQCGYEFHPGEVHIDTVRLPEAVAPLDSLIRRFSDSMVGYKPKNMPSYLAFRLLAESERNLPTPDFIGFGHPDPEFVEQ